MQDTDLLRSIDQKLHAVIRLLGAPLVQGKTKRDAVVTLDKLGLDRDSIADICGASQPVIRQYLYEESRTRKARRTTA